MAFDVPRLLQALGIQARLRPGGELWAPCPSHQEVEPSWSINAEGSHFCFGCGFNGGPVELVMQCYGFAARASALEWLEKHGLGNRIRVGDVRLVVANAAHGAFRMPEGVVVKPLRQWPTPILRYVIARGITPEQVQRWRIGYAVDGRLHGRVVFPFHNEDGRLASYSARTYEDSTLRYRTPSEDKEHPDPAALFGPVHWPPVQPDGRRDGPLVVTEGAIDALACERAGAGAVAALSGSSTVINPGKLARLSSFKEIVVATDPDRAGQRVWTQLQPLRRWATLHRARIPTGSDAAQLSKAELEAALWER